MNIKEVTEKLNDCAAQKCDDCKHRYNSVGWKKSYTDCQADLIREMAAEVEHIARGSNADCTSCVKDNTDACSRGAGRAVDDEVCEDYLDDKGNCS